MTDCGASKKIADTIVAHCGARTLRWGVMFVGIIFGISMFFEVGFMVVVPLVVSIAKEAKDSLYVFNYSGTGRCCPKRTAFFRLSLVQSFS